MGRQGRNCRDGQGGPAGGNEASALEQGVHAGDQARAGIGGTDWRVCRCNRDILTVDQLAGGNEAFALEEGVHAGDQARADWHS
jgi:hypothetical protein